MAFYSDPPDAVRRTASTARRGGPPDAVRRTPSVARALLPAAALLYALGGASTACDRTPGDSGHGTHDTSSSTDSGTRDSDTRDSGTRDSDTRDSGTRDSDTRDSGTRDSETGGADCAPDHPERTYTPDCEFVRIEAGSFTMGSPASELGRDDDELQHPVTLTRPIWMGVRELSREEVAARLGRDPSTATCDGCPATGLTWHEAAAVANAFSAEEGLPACMSCEGEGDSLRCALDGDPYACLGYRLPTEAEWEYAARAGSTTAFSSGADLVEDPDVCDAAQLSSGPELSEFAWYCDNADAAQAIGGLDENPWGLHDMHGNAFEWVLDGHAPYSAEAVEDPLGAPGAPTRVARGGAWYNLPRFTRSAFRLAHDPVGRGGYVGMRLARTIAP